MLDILVWLIALEAIALVSLPVILLNLKGLADNGYGVSKAASLLLLAYIAWVLPSLHLIDYGLAPLLLGFLVLAAASAYCIVFHSKELKKILKEKWKLFAKEEALFIIALLLFVLVRSHDPIISGQEKFMDSAFLNTIMRGGFMPPNDPWFTGKPINYYYFGHYIMSVPSILSGLPGYVAYNLALCTLFALTITGVFSVSYSLTKKVRYGLLGAFLVGLAGNAHSILQVVGEKQLLPFNYWPSSRVIEHTINEFPFFSFLHGDLHAHVIAIAFQVLAIAIILNFFLSKNKGLSMFSENKAFGIGFLALSLGVFQAMNAWDFPTYAGIAFLVIALKFYEEKRFNAEFFKSAAFTCVGIAALAYFLFLPFSLYYSQPLSIDFVHGSTELELFGQVFILFLYPTLVFLALKSGEFKKNLAYASLLAMALLVVLSQSLLLILLIPILFFSALALYKHAAEKKLDSEAFVFLLLLAGFGLTLLPEIFFFKDAFAGGEFYRMNTVFKFYLQAWVLLGIASAFTLQKLFGFALKKKERWFWAGLAVLLLAVSALYPMLATYTKCGEFKGDATLEGIGYMKVQYKGDYEAIKWISENIRGKPVMVEAFGDSFTYYNRVSANTGLPTIIGWPGHESQWRPGESEFGKREEAVNTIYSSTDLNAAKLEFKNYDVKYVYFGQLELQKYGYIGLAKFNSYPIVYENENTRIYEVG